MLNVLTLCESITSQTDFDAWFNYKGNINGFNVSICKKKDKTFKTIFQTVTIKKKNTTAINILLSTLNKFLTDNKKVK